MDFLEILKENLSEQAIHQVRGVCFISVKMKVTYNVTHS